MEVVLGCCHVDSFARATAVSGVPAADGNMCGMSGTPAEEIDARIAALPAWQAEMLSRIRRLIKQADSEVVEEVKWRKPSNDMAGVPAWSRDGLICTGEPYRDKVKLTFARGAALADPARLFNAGFGGNTRRAIDIFEGDELEEEAFVALVRAAVAENQAGAAR